MKPMYSDTHGEISYDAASYHDPEEAVMRSSICEIVGYVILATLTMTTMAKSAEFVSFFGLTFPETIGGARRDAFFDDFEKHEPGLGYRVHYRVPGWGIDLYIYDLRRPSIPAEATSEPLKGQLLQATGDVQRVANDVRIVLRYALLDDTGGVRFLCTSFNYKMSETPVDSYLCVTSSRGKFIKFRLTTRSQPGSEIWANRFVQSWTTLLWPS